jgi:hypothetical protein
VGTVAMGFRFALEGFKGDVAMQYNTLLSRKP